ncbi:unnamed protein product [Phytophthora fragariaefolia]|uniref:Unnamed protein product n=1 Tax=Phytophthora fragariaefolia TaxID=1490495 RepID=A0A9W6XNI2_9STRA|nr:unnamed protein product [Phytophthora fragariaefolia]
MIFSEAPHLCEGVPVLTVAGVVSRECLAKHNVDALPYVVQKIDGFLDTISGPGAMMRACNQGFSVRILAYIASRDTTFNWKDAAVSAAEGGHVHALEWLSTNYAGYCEWGTKVMDAAARYGHLKAVQWLHECRQEGCATDAMDWAIRRGDVSMAKWLQANRTEGCSDFAMNYAAIGGHLDVLQWLTKNRIEGRPGLALRTAAQHGHLNVVQWLYTDARRQRLALDDAKRFNHTAVAAWLHQQQSQSRRLHKVLVDGMKWICHSLQMPAAAKADDIRTQKTTIYTVQ